MMQVLAMHGWAGQAGTWSHWRQRFEDGGAKWSSADRGYSGGETVAPAWPPGPGRNLLIAHSLGLHLPVKQDKKKEEPRGSQMKTRKDAEKKRRVKRTYKSNNG